MRFENGVQKSVSLRFRDAKTFTTQSSSGIASTQSKARNHNLLTLTLLLRCHLLKNGGYVVAICRLKGIHQVRKRLANAKIREYHYAFRGGPQFWHSDNGVAIGSPDYVAAFSNAAKPGRLTKIPDIASGSTTRAVIERYRRSLHFQKLAERTQSDYEKYLKSFDTEFGVDPIKMFEEKESLGEIRTWKEQWSHSPKSYDYATSVVTRLLNWARDEDVALSNHHHVNVARLYKSNRSEIIWLPEELRALLAVANDREARVVIAASEGGLTPQDIGILTRDRVQNTPKGRRLLFKRSKSKKVTSIPVTPALAKLIDETPNEQKQLIISLDGRRPQPERASGIVRDLKARANAAAATNTTLYHIRDELRLYDMRGTAATELLRAGCSLNEIAVTMGWGLRHAANIIEKYAAIVPEVADEVLAKLTAARRESEDSK
ncbi:tyrosine-type recombinase/integrase [uncultured Thioclava sp.]|uniref:tyrosine-type recombinase/integrase n=1 Tax=uncultured Thioclava sp. TaxID=473858 RepID=UPI0025F5076D|nr:tyrosine-type recombinase/integrase [uncultured Thioclava sp.]